MAKKQPQQAGDLKVRIVEEIGNVSRSLAQVRVKSKAVNEARESFLRLTILLGEVLDIKW